MGKHHTLGEEEREQKRLMVEEWVNIPSRGEEGFTPLHFASFHGNLDMVKLLMNLGAHLQAKNKQGINMLHVAA